MSYCKALVVAATILAAPMAAQAATIYVANNCSGQPTPCTTDLQSALDNTSYSAVYMVAGTGFTGDYVIGRSLVFTGGAGASITRPSGGVYALRVESTSSVDVGYLTLNGRVAIYDSSDVTFAFNTVNGNTLGYQVVESDTVSLRTTTVDATDRAVDVTDSSDVELLGLTGTADDYGVVISSSTVSAEEVDIDGPLNTVVLQLGNLSVYPGFTAVDSTLTTGTGRATTWRWNRGQTSYTNCTPTPSESITSSTNLVGLIGYTPHGGD